MSREYTFIVKDGYTNEEWETIDSFKDYAHFIRCLKRWNYEEKGKFFYREGDDDASL